MPDGRIYGFPRMYFTRPVTGALMLNKDWFDTLDRAVPSNPSELLGVLSAFVAQGRPGYVGTFEALRTAFMGAYGIGNRGPANGYFDVHPQNGELRFWAADTAYRDLLALLADYYRAGVLDPGLFTLTEQQRLHRVDAAQAGLTAAPLTARSADRYMGLSVLTGPGGHQLWAGTVPQVEDSAAFIITGACRDVPLAMAWADGWLDNGRNAESLFWGVEGLHHRRDEENGPRRFLDDWGDSHSPYASGMFLGLIMDPDTAPTRSDAQAASVLRRSLPPVIWPRFPLTAAEQAVSDSAGARISEHVESFTRDVVTGAVTLNTAAWNEYRAGLDALDLEALTEVYALALGRYFAEGGR
jgi:hypothetical protein